MKNIKLLMIALLSVSLLFGCGSKTPVESSTSSSGNTTSASEETTSISEEDISVSDEDTTDLNDDLLNLIYPGDYMHTDLENINGVMESVETHIFFREDGTGYIVTSDKVSMTWGDGVITCEDGTTHTYTYDGLSLGVDDKLFTFQSESEPNL